MNFRPNYIKFGLFIFKIMIIIRNINSNIIVHVERVVRVRVESSRYGPSRVEWLILSRPKSVEVDIELSWAMPMSSLVFRV